MHVCKPQFSLTAHNYQASKFLLCMNLRLHSRSLKIKNNSIYKFITYAFDGLCYIQYLAEWCYCTHQYVALTNHFFWSRLRLSIFIFQQAHYIMIIVHGCQHNWCDSCLEYVCIRNVITTSTHICIHKYICML